MSGNRIYYILRRGKEYLNSWVEYHDGRIRGHAVFSVYRYDAARIRELHQAKRIVRSLMDEGEEWKIIRFNQLTGGEETVWKTEQQ